MPVYSSRVGIGTVRQDIARLDFELGLSLVLCFVLLILFISFRKNFFKLFRSIISFKSFWDTRRSQPWGELSFFILLFSFSVFPISFFLSTLAGGWSAAFYEASFPRVFFIFSVVLILFMALKIAINHIIGLISRKKQLFSDLTYAQLMFFSATALVLVPVLLVKEFLDERFAPMLLFLLSIFLLLILCLYFFRTIRLFLQEKNNFFFWILYFCTLEILPIIAIFKLLDKA